MSAVLKKDFCKRFQHLTVYGCSKTDNNTYFKNN